MSTNSPIAGDKPQTTDDFVHQITRQLVRVSKSWDTVAQLIVQAAEKFGDKSDEYRRIIAETGLQRALVCRLRAVGTSQRLRDHAVRLEKVPWTVRYEITTLTEPEFAELLKQAGEAGHINMKLVKAMKANRASKGKRATRSTGLPPLSISIEVKAEESPDQQELERAIATLRELCETYRFFKFIRQPAVPTEPLQSQILRMLLPEPLSEMKEYRSVTDMGDIDLGTSIEMKGKETHVVEFA